MTDATEHGDHGDDNAFDGLDVFDGPCVVCGETVKGRAYICLGLFGVFGEHGAGLYFTPDEDCALCSDWDDVEPDRVTHFECLHTYLDGVMIDLDHQRRQSANGGGQ